MIVEGYISSNVPDIDLFLFGSIRSENPSEIIVGCKVNKNNSIYIPETINTSLEVFTDSGDINNIINNFGKVITVMTKLNVFSPVKLYSIATLLNNNF